MRSLVLTGLLSLICTPLSAQQPTNNYGVIGSIGSEAGLGYALPYINFGVEADHSFKLPFESQTILKYSPTPKFGQHSGSEFTVENKGLFWVAPKFALFGGDEDAWLWTPQFNKFANFPSVGFTTRQYTVGLPSRIYLSYLIPMGARPIDGSLQSNRTQGVSFTWESQISPRVRLGMTFDVLTFLNQSGAGQSPRNWTGTFLVNLRIGSKQDPDLLY